jgi:hypothetical protein
MKKEFINEAKRMQELAGIINENELTDPELAIRWYDRLEDDKKQSLLKLYLPSFKPNDLSNEDKYWLWKKQQKL